MLNLTKIQYKKQFNNQKTYTVRVVPSQYTWGSKYNQCKIPNNILSNLDSIPQVDIEPNFIIDTRLFSYVVVTV